MLIKDNKSKIKFISLIVLVSLAIVTSYCYLSGENEYKIAENALKAKDHESALKHFARAINWYLPGASYVEDSINNILSIGEHYEESGRSQDAKYAYNILRGAIFSVRSTYSPHEEYLQEVNKRLAWLNADSIVKDDPGKDLHGENTEQLSILNKKDKPDIYWSSVASLSFLGWVFATIILIFKLFKNNVVNLNSGVIIISIVFTVFFTVWLISLVKA
jgi:hypothetical protein